MAEPNEKERGDFSEFFTLATFDEQKLGEMEWVLNSPAYLHTWKPYMLGILRSLQKMWKDRTRARQEKYPDEFLAGGTVFGEGLIEFFDKIIEETHHERAMKAMANMSNDDHYETLQQHGGVKPIVGMDQDATPAPYDPAEDY